MNNDRWPLGVFASVDAGFGVRFDVAQSLGVPTMHLHAPYDMPDSNAAADAFAARLSGLSIRPTAVFAGFRGESYDSIPIVQRTVGLVPMTTRAERVATLNRTVEFASSLNVDVVGLHIGFIPHDSTDADYLAIVKTLQQACEFAQSKSVSIHLETGQEPAEVLLTFLKTVDRTNLAINFDPANMILYGCGEPLPALEILGPYVKSVHCKDATWSDKPGETWGAEVPLGQGDVNMREYLKTLERIGYQGPLTIEREIPQEPERQKNEIGHAATLLNELKSEISTAGSEE